VEPVKLGIIGGSGLYAMEGLSKTKEVRVATPFGKPSDAYLLGTLGGARVAFLARHGRGHRILPSELNFRANIYGFKKLGVERILSVSAVGSLKEELKPLAFLIPEQFFDRTRGRQSTFFGQGVVAHVSFSDPMCPVLMDVLAQACERAGIKTVFLTSEDDPTGGAPTMLEPVPEAKTYRVGLYNSAMEKAWQSPRVVTNQVELPPDVRSRLSSGQRYFWQVTVEVDRGKVMKSRLFEFSLK